MKTYYTDYVRHCLRFHFKIPWSSSFDRISQQDWQACISPIQALSLSDFNLLKEIYSGDDMTADNVYHVSKKYSIPQDLIWKKMGILEKKVARNRELIP